MNLQSRQGKKVVQNCCAFGLHGAQFTVHQEKKLVVLQVGEQISVGDLTEYASLLRAHPLFKPNFSEIVDLRKAEKLTLQADEMMKLADKIDPFSRDAYRAFVVRTPTQAHAARMHKILRTQRNFEICHFMEEAERWIGERTSQPKPPVE